MAQPGTPEIPWIRVISDGILESHMGSPRCILNARDLQTASARQRAIGTKKRNETNKYQERNNKPPQVYPSLNERGHNCHHDEVLHDETLHPRDQAPENLARENDQEKKLPNRVRPITISFDGNNDQCEGPELRNNVQHLHGSEVAVVLINRPHVGVQLVFQQIEFRDKSERVESHTVQQDTRSARVR